MSLPRWALVLLIVSLVATLVMGGVTLRRVSDLEDQAAQARRTEQISTATKTLLALVAARQLKGQDLSGQIQMAQQEAQAKVATMQGQMIAMQKQVTVLQDELVKTQELLIELQSTMDQALTQAQAAGSEAKQSIASLRDAVEALQKQQQALRASLEAKLAQLRALVETIIKGQP